jgi:hypothetical protein
MFRRSHWRVGEIGFEGNAKSAYITVLARDNSSNILLMKVTTSGQLPSAVAGYAYGCLAICADSGALYYNSGGATSCTFTAIGTVTSNSLTTAMLQAGAVTPVKMGVKNVVAAATYMATGASWLPGVADILNAFVKITASQTQGFGLLIPAAATIIAAFSSTTGAWFEFDIYNNSGQTLTITGDTGVTLKGTATLANGKTARVTIIVTAGTTVDALIESAAA